MWAGNQYLQQSLSSLPHQTFSWLQCDFMEESGMNTVLVTFLRLWEDSLTKSNLRRGGFILDHSSRHTHHNWQVNAAGAWRVWLHCISRQVEENRESCDHLTFPFNLVWNSGSGIGATHTVDRSVYFPLQHFAHLPYDGWSWLPIWKDIDSLERQTLEYVRTLSASF